jgi:hypothetical protein
MERDRPTPERIEQIRALCGPNATGIHGDLLAEIEALRTALARVEGEKDLLDTKHFNATYETQAVMIERDAALSDCRILLAECEAARLWREAPPHECDGSDPHGSCSACEIADLWAEARAATDASGARARHAKGGGA